MPIYQLNALIQLVLDLIPAKIFTIEAGIKGLNKQKPKLRKQKVKLKATISMPL